MLTPSDWGSDEGIGADEERGPLSASTMAAIAAEEDNIAGALHIALDEGVGKAVEKGVGDAVVGGDRGAGVRSLGVVEVDQHTVQTRLAGLLDAVAGDGAAAAVFRYRVRARHGPVRTSATGRRDQAPSPGR